jgi:hypothetical protein
MGDVAKTIILTGVVLIVAGGVMLLLGKIPGAGKLPGDILIKKENFSFYFPITTCILISVILTILSYLWSRK